MNVPRETLMQALFEQLQTAVLDGQPAFVLASRKFVGWDQVDDANQPSLFLEEGNEHASQQLSYGQIKWRMRALAWVYCLHSPDEEVPGKLLNQLLDALEAAIKPPDGQTQTLGGLAANVYIDGEVIKSIGALPNDRQSLAVVPLLIETGV